MSDEVDAMVARTRAAADQDKADGFWATVGKAQQGQSDILQNAQKIENWLPRNVTIGIYKAALNTIDTLDSLVQTVGEPANKAAAKVVSKVVGQEIPPLGTPSLKDNEVFQAAHQIADEAEANNTFADDITQGVVQFAVPFTGYLKVLGGVKGAFTAVKVGKMAAAEAAAAASAFGPHEGRMADLIVLGKQMDNKFGAVLNKVAPDGSLLNAYVNWITNRENEGEWEGRFKNAVDSLVTTAGIAAFLKGSARTLRTAAEELASPTGTMKSQHGAIGVQPEAPKFEISQDKVMGSESFRQPIVRDGQEVGAIIGDVKHWPEGKVFRIRVSAIGDESAKGKGLGIEAYKSLVDNAFANDAIVYSDAQVSESANRVYESLLRRGYNVQKDPSAEWETIGGARVLTADRGQPVYKILPKKETK